MSISFSDVVALVGVLMAFAGVCVTFLGVVVTAFVAFKISKVSTQSHEIKEAVNGTHKAVQDNLDAKIKQVENLIREKGIADVKRATASP